VRPSSRRRGLEVWRRVSVVFHWRCEDRRGQNGAAQRLASVASAASPLHAGVRPRVTTAKPRLRRLR
jgi:hypothetical protein